MNFPTTGVSKSPGTYILTKGKLSYTTARETMLFALEISGLDKKQFGLHSLRSGDNCRST
jgi:hypothetical protein